MVGWLHWLYQTIRFHPISSFSPSSSYGNNMPPTKSQAKPLNSPFPTESWNNHRSCPRNGATPCSVATKIRFLGDFALGAKKKHRFPISSGWTKGLGKTKHRHSQESRPEDLKGVTSRYPMDLWCSACHQPSNCWSRHLAGVGFPRWKKTPGCHGSWKSVYHQVWGGGGAHLLMLMIPPSRFTLW